MSGVKIFALKSLHEGLSRDNKEIMLSCVVYKNNELPGPISQIFPQGDASWPVGKTRQCAFSREYSGRSLRDDNFSCRARYIFGSLS